MNEFLCLQVVQSDESVDAATGREGLCRVGWDATDRACLTLVFAHQIAWKFLWLAQEH